MNKQCFGDSRFFILDSANLEIEKSLFYGYAIIGNDIVTNLNESDYSRLNGSGAYVAIEKLNDEIILHQDFVGCYGIHLYEGKDGSFVISKSFLYLVEYLSRNHYEYTINSNYINYFATTQLCSSAYGQTAVNEISILDRCAQLHIRIREKSCYISNIEYEENSLAPDSPEGISVLDDWGLSAGQGCSGAFLQKPPVFRQTFRGGLIQG